jgi:hypothetical protein
MVGFLGKGGTTITNVGVRGGVEQGGGLALTLGGQRRSVGYLFGRASYVERGGTTFMASVNSLRGILCTDRRMRICSTAYRSSQ